MRVGKIDGDRIALYRVDVDPVAQLGGKAAALYTCAHHQPVKVVRLVAFAICHGDLGLGTVAVQAQDILPVQAAHAQALCSLGHARGELVNVTGGVTLCEVAAVVITGQRGLNGFHFHWGDGTARQTALGQHLAHFTGVVKTLFVAVDVKDAFLFEVEIHPFRLCPGKQMIAG